MPHRSCVGCRAVRPAAELLRFICDEAGDVRPGKGEPGRGAWICADNPDCLADAISRNAFARAFRRAVHTGSLAES